MTNELYERSGARALTPEKDHLDVIDPSSTQLAGGSSSIHGVLL
jgi:hypothetical protein